ncbi:hypothetical protein ACLB90_17810 [Stenotrophomonas sp. LGBM10]|uniref:hypothetical protein n=1 Tax=Stenotrophomonas sp. LGBM10 TaxID=3390038 RepID=UPI00398AAF65
MKSRTDLLRNIQHCLNVIARGKPLTDAERAEHLSRCAAEQAKAEALRADSQADDLLGGM